MIKHHPKFELIQSYVKGELTASLSAGIAMHAEMCKQCHEQIAQLTDELAEICFEADADHIENNEFNGQFEMTADVENADGYSLDFSAMADLITESSDIITVKPMVEKSINLNNQSYPLPRALNNMEIGKPANLGKLSRARLQLGENEIHSSLLHIAPGGGVPEHTHKGFELTLLLEGKFEDEHGEYEKGDFIMLDAANKHHPFSKDGCLCYTVANDALRFTQGLNKLLNPIGSLIY